MHVAPSGNAALVSPRLPVHTRRHRNPVKCLADQRNPSLSQPFIAPSPVKKLRHDQLVHLQGTVALCCLTVGSCGAAFAADAAAGTQPYVPSPINVGWEVYVGAIAGVIPFAIGSYQFVARILIQRRCQTCDGSGLVERGPFLRKCPECGGFFPWQGWKRFLTSTATPGNGGVLRQPRNQDGVIYKIPPKVKDETQNKP